MKGAQTRERRTSRALKLGQRFVNFEMHVLASLIPAKESGGDGFRRFGGLLQRSPPLRSTGDLSAFLFLPRPAPATAATPQNTAKGTAALQNECRAEARRNRTFVS